MKKHVIAIKTLCAYYQCLWHMRKCQRALLKAQRAMIQASLSTGEYNKFIIKCKKLIDESNPDKSD